MRLFLVRHGQTIEHEENRRQSPKSILGKNGRKQAKLVAQRFKNVKIDMLISSSWPRAFETAQEIGKTLKKDVEISQLIYEKEVHPSVYGLPLKGEEYEVIMAEVRAHKTDLDWKYKDGGESLREVITRAIKFEKHVRENHSGESIVAISHGIFLRCFVCICVYGEKYDDKYLYELFDKLSFDNTGVSELSYSEEKKEWKIIYLNDYSHLSQP